MLDFPGGPVVKILCFQCREHTSWGGHEKKKRFVVIAVIILINIPIYLLKTSLSSILIHGIPSLFLFSLCVDMRRHGFRICYAVGRWGCLSSLRRARSLLPLLFVSVSSQWLFDRPLPPDGSYHVFEANMEQLHGTGIPVST